MQDKTTILITKKTREELKKLGNKGDEYEDIIRKLIKKYAEVA